MTQRFEELDQARLALLSRTESREEMDANAERIDRILEGLPLLGTRLNAEDSEDFARETVAKSAHSLGRTLTVSEVEEVLHTPLEELVTTGYEDIANLSVDSFATSSLQGDPASDTLGLVTVSAQALEDGKLSKKEAAAIAISAAKASGSIVAVASGSLAFGPLGAVAAVPMAAFDYLGSQIDEEAEIRRLALEVARQKLQLEEREITAFLGSLQDAYRDWRRDIWDDADYAVSDVAQEWHRYEEELGVEFDLRFFPGEAPPPRGGFWTLGHTISSACVQVPAQPGGTLYFPRPPAFDPRGEYGGAVSHAWWKYEKEMEEQGLFLDPCKSGDAPKKFRTIEEEKYRYEEYRYFEKTIRAFNALMPEYVGPFWVPEGSPEREPERWRTYVELVRVKYANLLNRESVTEQEAMRRYLDSHAAYEAARAQNKSFPDPPDMFAFSKDYAEAMFRDLMREGEIVSSFTTRVLGDVIQTASAVRGEIEVAKQLRSHDMLGASFGQLSASDKRGVVFFSSNAGNPLNPLMLLVGLGAAAYGGYKYWRRHG